MLKKIDRMQYGTISKSCTTQALVTMIHKAFDFIDHNILVRKLSDYDISNHILCLIADFLLDRRQRVKLAQDCFSEWRYIPAGVPHGTKLGM